LTEQKIIPGVTRFKVGSCRRLGEEYGWFVEICRVRDSGEWRWRLIIFYLVCEGWEGAAGRLGEWEILRLRVWDLRKICEFEICELNQWIVNLWGLRGGGWTQRMGVCLLGLIIFVFIVPLNWTGSVQLGFGRFQVS
jgi:hypothetical protein